MAELLKKEVFSNLFPIPEYLLLANSSIVISDTSIKLAKLHQGIFKSSHRLSHFEKISLPDGVVQSGFIHNPDKLVLILSDLAQRHKLQYVYATLPEERTYLFTANIEKVPEEGLYDAVAFILEENAPVQLANSVFDFNVISEISESNQLKVAVSVISRKVIDFYLQVFQSAGITPVSFDVESQAIARAIIPRGDKRTQLIINLGHKKTGFYIVEDEAVQFTTTLPYGTGDSDVSSRLNDIKTEFRKISTFWNTRVSKSGSLEKKIEAILFCGSGALNDALVNELKHDSSVTFSIANVWVNAPDIEKGLSPELLHDALDFVSAIGLLLPNNKYYV